MSAGVIGMLLGLTAGLGLVLAISHAPPFRSVRLVDRLAPYVHDTPAPSRLLGSATQPGLLTAIRRVFGPAVGDGARLIDRLLGGGVVCFAAYGLMLRIGRLPEDVRVLQ